MKVSIISALHTTRQLTNGIRIQIQKCPLWSVKFGKLVVNEVNIKNYLTQITHVFLLYAIGFIAISAGEGNVEVNPLTSEKSLNRRSLSGFGSESGHTVAISANPWLGGGNNAHFSGGFGDLAVSGWNPWKNL